jgi:hypothetical protein
MRCIAYIYICISIGFFSCTTTKEYKLYRRDKSINYPNEDLTLRFINDTTGFFINEDKHNKTFNQKFNFDREYNKYLIIREVKPIDKNIISLNQGDTIVVYKNQLHFFYNGDKKYLLSFKKKCLP